MENKIFMKKLHYLILIYIYIYIYTEEIIKISSVTIVIMSLVEKDKKCYLELALKSLFVRNIKLNYRDIRIR